MLDVLRKKIRGKYTTIAEFATELGISSQEMSNKLNGKSSFTVEQIYKCVNLLGLTEKELKNIFFSKQVEKDSTK